MNKKISSVGTSLVLHLVFCVLALNTVIYTFAPPRPGNTQLLIHVRVDSKLLSLAVTNEKRRTSQKTLVRPSHGGISAPENELTPQNISMEHAVTSALEEKPEVVNKTFVSVVKETAPLRVSAMVWARRISPSVLISNEDVSKDLTVSSPRVSYKPMVPVLSAYKPSLAGNPGVPEEFSSATALGDFPKDVPNLSFKPATSAEDIKDFLGYDLRTYEDPRDHSRYFKLSIRVDEMPGGLAVIPKEIIFLVDSSNSIGPNTLREFKEGVENCFDRLGRDDRFNVIVFKNTAVSMSKRALRTVPVNIQSAKNFLDEVKANSNTDVYEAVLKGIDLKNPMKPAYVFLISDGQPTEGVTNPQQIINQIARINRGRVPVFAFGAGIFLERYLMSFLSMTNRGWAEFRPNDVSGGIIDLYTQIKDPVLINLRYYVSGLDSEEIYPKLLPDFFKGSHFVLYGRYTKEQLFYLQLYGDAKDGLKQYLIRDDVSQASRGDSRIAYEWATRKVYHLIGLLEYNKNNQGLLNEIKDLRKKFHLNLSSFVLEQIDRK